MKTLSILFAVALIAGAVATSSAYPKLQVSSVLNMGKAGNYISLGVEGDH